MAANGNQAQDLYSKLMAEWELGSEDRAELRLMLDSKGWLLLYKKLVEIHEEAREYFFDARENEEFLERRGFLDAYDRFLGIPDLLLDKERREELANVQSMGIFDRFRGNRLKREDSNAV